MNKRENILNDFYTNFYDEEFEIWIKYYLPTCERIELQGYSNHMLYICKKN